MAYGLDNRVFYNGPDKDQWVECREFLSRQKPSTGSNFLDVNALTFSEHKLEEDFKLVEDSFLPNKFADIGDIEF